MLASELRQPVLVETTSNECNQFGGYTGMKPVDFIRLVRKRAADFGMAPGLLYLGGDHTGVSERPVGLDAGIRTFAMLSDGGSLQRRPRQGVRSAIRRKQRTVSRSSRGSKSHGKKKAALARAHEWMAEAGRQELHRLADRVVRTCDFIAVEALKIRNMLRRGKGKRGLNRAIAEQGWREFLDILEGKAESAGIPFVEVPPAGTSQDCSRCGTNVPKALSERIHLCGVCGLELDRDQNAARNVLRRGLCIFATSRGSGWDGARRSRGLPFTHKSCQNAASGTSCCCGPS